MMLARIDFSPTLFHTSGIGLLIVLSLAAFFLSTLSPIPVNIRRRLLIHVPLVIFLYWFWFLDQFISLNPFVHYYLGSASVPAWYLETGICCAFGIAFSMSVWRRSDGEYRTYGKAATLAFAMLLLTMPLWIPSYGDT